MVFKNYLYKQYQMVNKKMAESNKPKGAFGQDLAVLMY